MKVLVSAAVFFGLPLSLTTQTPNRSMAKVIVLCSGRSWKLPLGRQLYNSAPELRLIYRGLGIGAEIGPVGPWSDWGMARIALAGLCVMVGSANLSYHFMPATTEGSGAVTAGYTIFCVPAFRQEATLAASQCLAKQNTACVSRFGTRNRLTEYRGNINVSA